MDRARIDAEHKDALWITIGLSHALDRLAKRKGANCHGFSSRSWRCHAVTCLGGNPPKRSSAQTVRSHAACLLNGAMLAARVAQHNVGSADVAGDDPTSRTHTTNRATWLYVRPMSFCSGRERREARMSRLSSRVREAVKERDGWRCVWCGSDEFLEVDHIISTYMNGSNDLGNLQTLCRSCHRKKTSADAAIPQNNAVLTGRIKAGRGGKSGSPRGWLVLIIVILAIAVIGLLAL